ncbi:MAG TPA: multicopper oxidase domain-containing protein [Bryobacteraceae bacterium]|jgi:FtsP/CotA-like multicopper oxidase with cupredoxin domain|nr:multicopper oxidase domain-containing protein [Bryobacteraceae bacterium]
MQDTVRELKRIVLDADTRVPATRRGFLGGALASAVSGLALTDWLSSILSAQPTPPDCSKPGDPFVPVVEFVSKNGKLEANFTVTQAVRSVAVIAQAGYQCRPMKVRYYEGAQPATGAKWPHNPHIPGPGPVLRAQIGDEIAIHLLNDINPAEFPQVARDDHACNVINQISPTGGSVEIYPAADTPPSCFHGFNITNLHYHGTHVTPDGHGDNVMIDVVPQSQKLTPAQEQENQKRKSEGELPIYYRGRFENFFKLTPPPPPDDPSKPMHMGQAPGTHWYHAHKHGSVAMQLLNGMAGAFIIEGEFDEQLDQLMPGLKKSEKVLVIQQLGDTIAITPATPSQVMITGIGGNPFPVVNGQVEPTIEMHAGEIQRWRFVNATMSQTAYISYWFLGQDVYDANNLTPSNRGYVPEIRQIAYDGVQLAPERYADPAFGQAQQFTLAPANRVDILVQAPATAGRSLLVFQAISPTAGTPTPAPKDPILLRLNVIDSPVSGIQLPTPAQFPKIPAWLQWDEKDPRNAIKKKRTLTFNNDAHGRPAIDGHAFDGVLTRQEVYLNDAEEWTLENNWFTSIHPFHIHVNPFQVLEIFDPYASSQVQLTPPYNWHDTIAIPPLKFNADGSYTPGRVRIRSRFLDFPGTFVLHCHILDHEDRGMMQEVDVVDPAAPKLPPPNLHH